MWATKAHRDSGNRLEDRHLDLGLGEHDLDGMVVLEGKESVFETCLPDPSGSDLAVMTITYQYHSLRDCRID